MMRDSLPLRTCVFEGVSRKYEVVEAHADGATYGFLINVVGDRFL